MNNQSIYQRIHQKKFLYFAIPLIAVVFIVVIFFTATSLNIIKNPFQKFSIIQKPKTTVSIKSDYKNPFDKKTQYVNPFDQYKNPFTTSK